MRMRCHAKFIENVPLALILIGLLEMQAVPDAAIHALGGKLVLGRIMHFVGFGEDVRNVSRGIGARWAFGVIDISGVCLGDCHICFLAGLGEIVQHQVCMKALRTEQRIAIRIWSAIEQVIFDEIVEQAIEKGLVAGEALSTDSTHLKANANKRRHTVFEVNVAPMAYLEELEAAVEADRAEHDKKPLKPKERIEKTKPTKISDTDPDAGYMYRDQKPEGFFYLDHRTVDGRCGIITDTYVTPGNVHDSRPYLDRLDRQCDRFDLAPSVVGLDAGYNNTALCHGLIERGIDGVVGYKSPHGPPGRLRTRKYRYDREANAYICPMEQVLAYSTTGRDGYRTPRPISACSTGPGGQRAPGSTARWSGRPLVGVN